MTYNVTISAEGYYNWEGEAESEEEAKELALEEASEADFGELEDIDLDVCDVYAWRNE